MGRAGKKYASKMSVVGILVDSKIDLSTRNVYARVFITSGYLNVIKSDTYQQDVINTDHLSTWLMVGKLGQGMRCCKCNSNSDVLVCEIIVFSPFVFHYINEVLRLLNS